MKIRVLSDLHLDINKDYPFELEDKDTFTIICGDISANTDQTIAWIRKNVHNGVFVEGNHIGYDSLHTVQYIEKRLARTFPTIAPVTYLKNRYKIVDDVVFVGGILWTDFKLFDDEMSFLYEHFASTLMNDYRYNYSDLLAVRPETKSNFMELLKKDWIRKLEPKETVDMFKETLKSIENACKKFPDKKIVVVTHHAPSIKSVQEMYLTDKITPAFASNLENFILEHPNIKLWCHGHIHSASDYHIGQCRVICNPRGYVKFGEKSGFDNGSTATI